MVVHNILSAQRQTPITTDHESSTLELGRGGRRESQDYQPTTLQHSHHLTLSSWITETRTLSDTLRLSVHVRHYSTDTGHL